MVNAHLDTLELELRKLDGVRTVGFTSQHDVLYIQLFVEASAPAATLPFEATRIAQRHSSSPVAVELVRWTNLVTRPSEQQGLASIFSNTHDTQPNVAVAPQNTELTHAGSIGNSSVPSETPSPVSTQATSTDEEDGYDDSHDIREEPSDYIDMSQDDEEIEPVQSQSIDTRVHDEDDIAHEVDLAAEENAEENNETAIEEPFAQREYGEEPVIEERRGDDIALERIALLLVTTSSENDEIEVHLSFDELRTIGRAATNRGLLGAIDATVDAISELTGSNDFHAEWARSLEPGAEHASLVAVGLTNSQGTDTRHGIAGGTSPIEAAARATLNALNRTAVLAAAEQ